MKDIDFYEDPQSLISSKETVKNDLEISEETDINKLYKIISNLSNELEKTQRELAKKNIELLEINEQKNKVLSTVAHDLRNPLNVIMGFSELLLYEPYNLNSEEIEFLNLIKKSANFMFSLVNELLDISKMELAKPDLNLELSDIVELVKENIHINKKLAEKKQINLFLHIDGDIPPIIVDKIKIDQILNNLISNAIKYSHENKKVYISIENSINSIKISVKDEGQGIPENELKGLFNPFHKTSVKSTAGEKSTGLGLAIAKKIVTEHKGRIWVESKVGEGSTFFVLLPINQD